MARRCGLLRRLLLDPTLIPLPEYEEALRAALPLSPPTRRGRLTGAALADLANDRAQGLGGWGDDGSVLGAAARFAAAAAMSGGVSRQGTTLSVGSLLGEALQIEAVRLPPEEQARLMRVVVEWARGFVPHTVACLNSASALIAAWTSVGPGSSGSAAGRATLSQVPHSVVCFACWVFRQVTGRGVRRWLAV